MLQVYPYFQTKRTKNQSFSPLMSWMIKTMMNLKKRTKRRTRQTRSYTLKDLSLGTIPLIKQDTIPMELDIMDTPLQPRTLTRFQMSNYLCLMLYRRMLQDCPGSWMMIRRGIWFYPGIVHIFLKFPISLFPFRKFASLIPYTV